MKVLMLFCAACVALAATDPSTQGRLTTGRVRITFTESGGPAATAVSGTVYFSAPGLGDRQRQIPSFGHPLEIDSMPPGTYRFTVVAQSVTSVLVASRVHEVGIDREAPEVGLTIDLVARRGWARVVDSTGAPVAGAAYYTAPSSVNSTADDEGRINLATIAPGTAMTVRTIQWGMTCHVVTAGALQTIAVPDAAEALVISAPTTPTSTLPQRRQILPSLRLVGAKVSGLPGADCPVPYEHFPVTLAKVNGRTEHTMLLPFGRYSLALLDGRVLTAHAPGRLEIE